MHIFENADVDWLHCIAAHRKEKMFIEQIMMLTFM